MSDIMIQARHVVKHFGTNTVLDDVSLDVPKGQVCAVIGPSGAGKSTLLRCVNHLEKIDGGEVRVDGEIIGYHEHADKLSEMSHSRLVRQRSQIGMVFQHFNLYPHLTAEQNITLAQTIVHNRPIKEAKARTMQLLERVGLENKANRHPRGLSGGEQQRVGIARALAIDPKVILFDEPTSALDPELVGEVLAVIRDVLTSGITALVVTHEIAFAREVADNIVFMAQGQIVERGDPGNILVRPQEARTQQFLERVLH
jgi:polar amino acid transport system ATP-binding protein